MVKSNQTGMSAFGYANPAHIDVAVECFEWSSSFPTCIGMAAEISDARILKCERVFLVIWLCWLLKFKLYPPAKCHRPPLAQNCFCMLLPPLWPAVEQCESGEEETMETLVAADSLLNIDCPDTLSLEQYCKHTHTHTHTHTPTHTWVNTTHMHANRVKMPQ